jgi:hypothetical protein
MTYAPFGWSIPERVFCFATMLEQCPKARRIRYANNKKRITTDSKRGFDTDADDFRYWYDYHLKAKIMGKISTEKCMAFCIRHEHA